MCSQMRNWLFFSFFIFVTADEIINLPGVDFELNFKQYSGYLDASSTRKLHYWFVESQNDPSTDPIIFWFNGGPGCSSLSGLFRELGPFLINADGKTLYKNEYSWNKNASVVFIESPAGVGFSYSTDGNITTNDNITAIQNYEAIKQFYSKFAQFRHNDVFIAGESYAGVYILTLTVEIIDGLKDFDINLKGIAIGNGLVSKRLRFETTLLYYYFHGVIDEETWEDMVECCDGKLDGCDFRNCENIKTFRLYDPYDLHSKCSVNKTELNEMVQYTDYHETASEQVQNYLPESIDELSQQCIPKSSLKQYLNTPEVRNALHIPPNVDEWNNCNSILHKREYQKSIDIDQSDNIKKIVGNKIRTLLYYGDMDSICNFVMGQKFSDRLGLEKLAGKTAWFYDNQIVGGYKTEYDNLTFLTINGAGHAVPQSHPRQIQQILQRFIDGTTI